MTKLRPFKFFQFSLFPKLTFDFGYVEIENHSVHMLTSKSLLVFKWLLYLVVTSNRTKIHEHYNITVYHNSDDRKVFFYISFLKLQCML